MSIERLYGESIHERFPSYFAQFPPDKRVALGDYGIVTRESTFKRQGNVADFGLTFTEGEVSLKDSYFHFTTNGKVTGGSSAGVEEITKTVQGTLSVEFHKGNGVFFNAQGCRHRGIFDEAQLGSKLLDLYARGVWDSKYVVIVEIVKSKLLTVAVSEQGGGHFQIKGNVKVQQADFLSAFAGAKTETSSDIGFQWSGKETLPLLQLARIRPKLLFGSARFSQHNLASSVPKHLEEMPSTEQNPPSLEFSRIEGDDLFTE